MSVPIARPSFYLKHVPAFHADDSIRARRIVAITLRRVPFVLDDAALWLAFCPIWALFARIKHDSPPPFLYCGLSDFDGMNYLTDVLISASF